MKKHTYEKTPGQKKWWWTRKELRTAHSLPRTLVKDEQLFPWLTLNKGTIQPRTTSPLEGGINTQIKCLLDRHRGIPIKHVNKASCFLYPHTQSPTDPRSLITPEHYAPLRKTRSAATPKTGLIPALLDTHFSPKGGNHIRHGWTGQNH